MKNRYKINLDDINVKEKISKYSMKETEKEFPLIFDDIIRNLSNENYTVFDAQKIMDKHFTEKNYDVFVSHSHQDIDYVKRLAGYYESQNKKVFIDSMYWDYSDELLRALDNHFCKKIDSDSYSYEKRNITTTIIHNLLAVSLEKMIDKCDDFIFVYSNNTSGGNLHQLLDFSNEQSIHTVSPWIYKELITAGIIYKNKSEVVIKGGTKRSLPNNSTPLFLYDIGELIRDYRELDDSNMDVVWCH